MYTPIQAITADRYGNSIYMKREDLLPFSFGGNKARIAEEYFADLQTKGCDCIIGYGNIRSNLCRVLANRAFSLHIPCHIVCPVRVNDHYSDSFNSKMVKQCGAVIHPCEKTTVSVTIESVMMECRAAGQSPYYVNGNSFGNGNEAVSVRAYTIAYREILEQSAQLGVKFDYIFLATGYGMTYAGLLAGQKAHCGQETIVGISVARSAKQVTYAIQRFTDAYAHENHLDAVPADSIHVCDASLCGGYGEYTPNIQKTIAEIYQLYGIPLDPTYTGKAYYGMKQYLTSKNVSNKNILFIHTGGLPLFFDYIADLAGGGIDP